MLEIQRLVSANMDRRKQLVGPLLTHMERVPIGGGSIPRDLFADILRIVAELRPPPAASTA